MTATEATNAIVILGVPIIVARLVVGLTYVRRYSRVWSFSVPTAAIGILLLRIAISRNFSDIIGPNDWIATASFAAVVMTQLLATIYGWNPVGEAPAVPDSSSS